jgi:hypothetical protein
LSASRKLSALRIPFLALVLFAQMAFANEKQSGKPHLLKIYPPVGQTSVDGHNFIYTSVNLWEDDVFQFLDGRVKP